MFKGVWTAMTILVASLGFGGCSTYSPGGGLMASTAGTASALTYPSTAESPKTISIVDVRTGEMVFERAIPPGNQMSLQFFSTKYQQGDPGRPETMRYAIQTLGQRTGRLGTEVAVPPSWARRIDVYLRAPDPYTPMDRTQAVQPMEWTQGGNPPASTSAVPQLAVPTAAAAVTSPVTPKPDASMPEVASPEGASQAEAADSDTAEPTPSADPTNEVVAQESPAEEPIDTVEAAPAETTSSSDSNELHEDADTSENQSEDASKDQIDISLTPLSTMTWTDTGAARRVRVLDTRSGDAVFEVDVPAESDLILYFYQMWRPVDADPDVESMHWQIVAAGSTVLVPSHQATVPSAQYRQIQERPIGVAPATTETKPVDAEPADTEKSVEPTEAAPPVDLLDDETTEPASPECS